MDQENDTYLSALCCVVDVVDPRFLLIISIRVAVFSLLVVNVCRIDGRQFDGIDNSIWQMLKAGIVVGETHTQRGFYSA